MLFASTLLVGTAYADGFGFSLGPFSLQFGGPSGRVVTTSEMASDPICSAISQHKDLEIIVEGREKVSNKEAKIVTKKITIEPYLFGTNNRRQPVLKGKVISEKMLREVTIKYGEEEKDNAMDNQPLSGVFQTKQKKGDVSTLNIDKIQRINIVEDSHFDTPKDYDKNSYNDVVNVICELDTND